MRISILIGSDHVPKIFQLQDVAVAQASILVGGGG
jgi:hypothetical protein